MKIGVDFGTTNSAVAAVDASGRAQILELFPGERLQRTVIHCDPRGVLSFGNAAFTTYVKTDLDGRLLRSLKSFLSADVPKTTLGTRRYAFTELVTLYLRFLIRRAEAVTGETVTEVVMGRPVHFNVDESLDDYALNRLMGAIAAADVPVCSLQLEPVAAAYTYERQLDRDRFVLVGDFGGGTSDFAILRVGPTRFGRRDRLDDVLATSGVGAAGDALDGRFMDAFLLDFFGRGARYHDRYDTVYKPWEHPIQKKIQRLYYLHLLRDEGLRRRLEDVQRRMDDPTVVRRLLRLIFDDLGYPMAWAIEGTKKELSQNGTARFTFDEFYSPTLDLDVAVDLPRFADASSQLLSAYQTAVTQALNTAGLDASAIDDVFLTGGTSQLPFIRAAFSDRFGADKLRPGDSMTSVCAGLALHADTGA